MGCWVDLGMIKRITLLLFIRLAWGQVMFYSYYELDIILFNKIL